MDRDSLTQPRALAPRHCTGDAAPPSPSPLRRSALSTRVKRHLIASAPCFRVYLLFIARRCPDSPEQCARGAHGAGAYHPTLRPRPVHCTRARRLSSSHLVRALGVGYL
eukprot:scaffold97094_cov75-Phaeocystis_antarctica.AAC.1